MISSPGLLPWFLAFPLSRTWVGFSSSSVVVAGLQRLRLFLAGRMPLALSLPSRVVPFDSSGCTLLHPFVFTASLLSQIFMLSNCWSPLLERAGTFFILDNGLRPVFVMPQPSLPQRTATSGITREGETRFRVLLLAPEDLVSLNMHTPHFSSIFSARCISPGQPLWSY
ncbi:hypothetical protein C8R45DRAFT_1027319 [Mycena sanguinolenta]|nr:hypothetical protein C8R45DRAFT_1027319 [Mycena sanguinolenta]